MAVLYRHIRLDKKEPFYIGIGKTASRAYSDRQRSKSWKDIVNLTKYEVDILFEDLTWEEACEKEIEFISVYGRRDFKKGPLVNHTDGGSGLSNPSDYVRMVGSKNPMKRPEVVAKMIKSLTGKKKKNVENYKKPKSEEHRRNIGISNSKPKVKLKCPHCSYVGGGSSNMKRWHFDNCKNKK